MIEETDKLRQEIESLKNALQALSDEFHRANFSSRQDFTKMIDVKYRFKVPHYDSVPPFGETGELMEIGGKLYICNSTNNFSKVGLQT
jgi:hypothetical protein